MSESQRPDTAAPAADQDGHGLEPSGRIRQPARTLRRDRWWVSPLVTAVVLTVFLAYTLVRVFMGRWYWVRHYHYLTPLYSPCLSESCVPGSAHLGTPLGPLPTGVPITIISFVIILGFRATCYYYRKATYRSFLLSPPACEVREPGRGYRGESAFPLIVQNSHRYFLYLASVLLLINTYDAVLAFLPANGGVGVGVGTLLLAFNAITLRLYTLSCHACRHVFGGGIEHHFVAHPRKQVFMRISLALRRKWWWPCDPIPTQNRSMMLRADRVLSGLWC